MEEVRGVYLQTDFCHARVWKNVWKNVLWFAGDGACVALEGVGCVGGASGGVGGGQGGAAILHCLSDMLVLLARHHCGCSPLAGGYDGWGGEGVQNLQ